MHQTGTYSKCGREGWIERGYRQFFKQECDEENIKAHDGANTEGRPGDLDGTNLNHVDHSEFQ